tara:strand:- start:18585 stop:18800 length:216 start_codon:yes stop_codon:yes gene_type:complete
MPQSRAAAQTAEGCPAGVMSPFRILWGIGSDNATGSDSAAKAFPTAQKQNRHAATLLIAALFVLPVPGAGI